MVLIPDPEKHRWRVGRKVGRTIYAVQWPEETTNRDDDQLVGMMDSDALAEEAVRSHNIDVDIRNER